MHCASRVGVMACSTVMYMAVLMAGLYSHVLYCTASQGSRIQWVPSVDIVPLTYLSETHAGDQT